MSRVSGRRSGVETSPEPTASTPRSSRTDSPARRQSSSTKKNAAGSDATPSKRTASPAGPSRRRAAERVDSAPQRAVSPAFISEEVLAKDKVAPLRTTTLASPTYRNAQATPYTPFTPITPGGDHPLSLMRHAADAGKLHLGFHNDQYIEDISVEWMYRPHTVTALAIIVGVLLFLAFRLENSGDWLENLRIGVGVAAFFFIVLGMLIFPSGPFIRPHPVVWRVAFGVGVLYELWLIVLLFQTKHHARESMKFFDSSLGVPVTERSYAASCELTVQNVMGNVDMFVVSHFVGWIIKALIIRDGLICWVISIQWELIEMLFMHMLPNFAECWWDQWILDVGLSNALGIYIGCKLAKYLEVKEYRWGSYSSIPSYLGKAKRTLLQFTPASWTRVEWKPTSSIKRIVAVQMLILCLHLEELNAFMLKFILWVPPESKLNVVRLAVWAFVGVPSLRQIYSYLSDPRCKRIGHQTFLCVIILLTELILIVKFGQGEFPKPMPHNVQRGLAIFMAIYAIGLVFIAVRAPGAHTTPSSSSEEGNQTNSAKSEATAQTLKAQ